MAVLLEIPFRASVPSGQSAEQTFAFLSDWPESFGKSFPGLSHFKALSPNVYTWEFDEVGYQSFRLKIAFTTEMKASAPGRIEVASQPGPHYIYREALCPRPLVMTHP